MQNVYAVRPLVQPGFFRRLLNLPVPENGYIELENLLASRRWPELHHGHIEEVLRRHGVKALDRLRARDLYARAVTTFANDDLLTDGELAELQVLRNLLGIGDTDAEEVERRIVHPHYQRRLAEVLADETVTDGERASLTRLRNALRIDERAAIALWDQATEPILTRRWQEAVSDRRLSDEEQHRSFVSVNTTESDSRPGCRTGALASTPAGPGPSRPRRAREDVAGACRLPSARHVLKPTASGARRGRDAHAPAGEDASAPEALARRLCRPHTRGSASASRSRLPSSRTTRAPWR